MTRIDELFAAFEAEHRAGGPADPRAYLARVAGDERDRLAQRIDAYLDDAAPPPWDPDAYERSAASPRTGALLARMDEELTDLLAMAAKAELLPREVAGRLAASLGLSRHEPLVRARYHELQSGHAPVDRVSGRVWDALASIFGTTQERVRAAARRAAAAAAGEADLVFARRGVPAGEPVEASAAPDPADPAQSEVDAAFFD